MAEKICGIYCIENLANGKKYIGQTIELNKRWHHHILLLRKNGHRNKYLQNSWNKHGEENFKFYILEYCEPSIEILNSLEAYYINKLKTKNPHGYNLTDGGDGTPGREQTEEFKIFISGVMSGNKNWLGKKHSAETKKKMSEAQRGEKHPMFGKHHTKEAVEKIRTAQIGRKHTEESKIKIGKAQEGVLGNSFGKKSKTASSKYFGVSSSNKGERWRACIGLIVEGKHKTITIGSMKSNIENSEVLVAKMYDLYIIRNNLPHPLNFPEDYSERNE